MANFCGKCGTMLDANGKCPKCGNVKGGKPAKQPKVKKEKNGNAKNRNISLKIIITVLVLASVTLVATVLLMIFGVIGNPFSNGKINSGKSLRGESTVTQEPVTEQVTEEPRDKYVDTHTAEDFTVATVDADEYYSDNGVNVVSKSGMSDSSNIRSESETYNDFKSRGFGMYDAYTNYDENGDYYDGTVVSSSSDKKHPMYYTYYVAQDGNMWIVFAINGKYMACLAGNSETATVISETGTVLGYDAVSHNFYETSPSDAGISVKKADRIDAETLENYFTQTDSGNEEGEW